GVYLITGGLAGNGYALASFLARSLSARLVLAEETPLPAADKWPELEAAEAADADPDGAVHKIRRVRALEALGAEVLVLDAALTEETQMGRALEAAEERFGALHGVIHAAGMVGQKAVRAIRETGYEEAAWHFVPKIHALFVLERVLGGRELDFSILISSSASFLGGLAYGAYTAANLAMDAFARDPGRRA
ncbi:MAG: SDR family NAD(P)-dependent oxidoreductase, partial [FCB group bacterium]|nr:SDR family NAD(P)-dependent oxidoreductase [FCB group bacterium]